MAKTRALLTETEREQIADKHGKERRYQAASRVRGRIKEELPKDAKILRSHHSDLLKEFFHAVKPIFVCPLCGDPYPRFSEIISHLMRPADGHDLTTEEIEELAPLWWQEYAEEGWQFS